MITRWLGGIVWAAAASTLTVANGAEEPLFSRFLPLAEGNTWTYSKTVPANSRVRTWVLEQDEKRFSVFTIDLKPATDEETYVVRDRDKDSALWKIQVTTNGQYARDARYAKLGKCHELTTFWGRVPSSEHLIEIGEVLERRVFGSKWRHEARLLAEPLDKGVTATLGMMGSSPYEVASNVVDERMSVRAGTWNRLLKVVFKGFKGQYTATSYYALDVGLIHEVQKDADGNIAYTMELTKYQLK